MFKFLILLLPAVISLQANAAWSAAAKSQTYKVSVTIPASADQSSPSLQTQRLVRNNKTVTVQSAVVP